MFALEVFRVGRWALGFRVKVAGVRAEGLDVDP